MVANSYYTTILLSCISIGLHSTETLAEQFDNNSCSNQRTITPSEENLRRQLSGVEQLPKKNSRG